MLFWNRPRPKFQISDLLLMSNGENATKHVVLVKNVRRTKLNDGRDKQWVYDGLVITARGNRVLLGTDISGVPERSLHRWY